MPDQKPQFSIIIPTGNRARLARMAVQSVLDQSFDDFEIIIADWTGSDENRELADRDRRIIYMRTESDTPYGGWNVSVRRARGNYILWLDDDNYLLPYALKLLNHGITETHADVITSTHLYYYDNKHPRTYVRNSLGVIPFSDAKRFIDLKQILKDQFAFKRSSSLPRLHTSATAVSSRVVQQSLEKLGLIIIDYLPNIHSMFPILFSFAKTAFLIDHPTVIVGRYGNSLSQDWAIMARKRFKKQPFPIKMSPVSGYARINSTLENYLNVKNALPDFYRDVPINYEQFAKIYMQELAYLDASFATLIKNWINLFGFLKTLPGEIRNPLIIKALKFAALAPFVYMARRLKLYPFWRVILGYFISAKEAEGNALQKISGKKEFYIPLGKKYKVNSIDALAKNVRQILIAETNRDIFNIPR